MENRWSEDRRGNTATGPIIKFYRDLNSPFKLRLDYFYDKNLGDILSVKKDR